MLRKQIMKDVEEIFRDVFDDESVILTDETTAKDIEDWDSFMHIRLITAMEEYFHIKFRLKEITGLQNVGETINLIKKIGRAHV